MEQLAPVTEKFGVVGEVRGKGLMIGIELVGPDGRTPNPAAASRAIEHAGRPACSSARAASTATACAWPRR